MKTIIPKYDIGEDVYYIKQDAFNGNYIKSGKIKEIHVKVDDKYISVSYKITETSKYFSDRTLFRTRQELLDSLETTVGPNKEYGSYKEDEINE